MRGAGSGIRVSGNDDAHGPGSLGDGEMGMGREARIYESVLAGFRRNGMKQLEEELGEDMYGGVLMG